MEGAEDRAKTSLDVGDKKGTVGPVERRGSAQRPRGGKHRSKREKKGSVRAAKDVCDEGDFTEHTAVEQLLILLDRLITAVEGLLCPVVFVLRRV
ncbi:MAG: hypothetical protein ACKPKO_46765, partial [Candidatus Fonsibacter sp.]